MIATSRRISSEGKRIHACIAGRPPQPTKMIMRDGLNFSNYADFPEAKLGNKILSRALGPLLQQEAVSAGESKKRLPSPFGCFLQPAAWLFPPWL
ncbi:hypothetical protein PO860_05940 [Rhizobium sp. BJ04]|uniref:hypothetical protein n=1 Tax=Rhizobium binxianense TaxID=3024242 RepID=UPI0023A95751|nr:hypothetical protein [Rhizobium sp. BJ04]WEA61410.1 hypothetical protein PO860_05940 [Rhizobium sp. BJ04]